MIRAIIFTALFFANQAFELAPFLEDEFANILDEAQIESECRAQLEFLFQGLKNREDWALKMVDASAKPQAGLLGGHLAQAGNYDQCLAVSAKKANGTILGKYCTMPYTMPDYMETISKNFRTSFLQKMLLSYGFCVPEICRPNDVQNLWNNVTKKLGLDISFTVWEECCDYQDKSEELSILDMVAFVFFGGTAIIIISSTVYDLAIFQKLHDQTPNLLMAFSLYTNGRRLFSPKKNPQSLDCLNGIRVIAMFWIILGHEFMLKAMTPNINSLYILSEWKISYANFHAYAAPLAVDTFLTVTGLLTVYTSMTYKKFGPSFYVHRLFRLLPALIPAIFFCTSVLKFLGSGPYWAIIRELFEKSCLKNWWATILFVQNFHSQDQCLMQAWYLSVDMQIYLFSPILLIPMVNWPRAVLTLAVLLMSASTVATFLVTWNLNTGISLFDFSANYMDYVYHPSYLRVCPWIIGGILGYFIHQSKKTTVRKEIGAILWVASLSTLFLVAWFQIYLINESNVLHNALYNSLSRIFWSLALIWIIYACVFGQADLVNRFLSSPIFTILVRLNYSMFLLHLFAPAVVVGNRRSSNYFSNLTNIHDYCGNLLVTLLVSIPWTLAFESPTTMIEKIYFQK